MNKPIKAKNLPLFSIIDLNQLRRENHLEGTEVTDFFTERDGKVYLLMEQPSETQGKDWLSTPSTYIPAYRCYAPHGARQSPALFLPPNRLCR